MVENIDDARKSILELPLNSIIYFDILSEEDKARLSLYKIQFTAMESLLMSFLKNNDEEVFKSISWEDILNKYCDIYSQYIAILYVTLSDVLGEDILIPLYEPVYHIGYDNISEKIYIYKRCPLHKA